MHLIANGLVLLFLSQALASAGGATIRGRILDPDGQPMPNVEVRAVSITGDREALAGSTMSDAAGTFAIDRIVPGRVLLRAQPRPPRHAAAGVDVTKILAHPPAYFPGVLALADAWPIDVKNGEIVELDFPMPAVIVGSIKASVSGPDGYTLEQVRVMRPEANQIKNVTVGVDGVGYADNLREGRYVVAARGRSKDARLAAFQIVHISAGDLPVALALAPAARITGRVVAERGGIPPTDGLRVIAAWTDGTIDLDPLTRDEAAVGPDGTFTIDGVFGMRAIRVSGLSEAWRVASIRHGRADITASSVTVDSGGTSEVVITVARK